MKKRESVPMPHSDACERNKGPILEVLAAAFADVRSVLEIGSGTGQHNGTRLLRGVMAP